MVSIRPRPTTSDAPERFESDRESFPFPAGGVFGAPTTDPSSDDDTPGTADAHRVLRTIQRMQSSLDELERELGNELERELHDAAGVIGRIESDHDDDWPPPAA